MIASIIIANNLALNGEGFAKKLAGNVLLGGVAKGYRNTFGRGFSKLSQSEGLKDTASQGGIRGWAARQALKTTRAGAKASGDLRRASAFGKTLGKDLGIGEGKKGGYEATLQAQVKARQQFASSLGAPGDTDTKVMEISKRKDMQGAAVGTEEIQLKRAQEQLAETVRTRRGDRSPEAQNAIDTARSEVEKRNTAVNNEKAKLKTIEDELKKEKSRRQDTYADTLASEKTADTAYTKVARKNKEAARAIRAAQKKSDQQKQTESIVEAIKENSKPA